MKRISIILTCAALFMTVGSINAKAQETICKESETTCENSTANEVGCISIDAEGFAQLVADISQAEWKYLGDKPAIVDFYAEWCGPCKRIAPILEEIAKAYDGKLYVYKVNVDDAYEVAEAFNIVSIPTLLFIPMEGNPEKRVGLIGKETIEGIITEQLLK